MVVLRAGQLRGFRTRSSLVWVLAYSALAIATTALLGSCRTEKTPPPIGTRLSAPTGLLVTSSGGRPMLIVSNANFRLEFDSGSAVAIDLGALDETKRFNDVTTLARSAVVLPNFSGPIALS